MKSVVNAERTTSKSSYQVALTVCEACGEAAIDAAGQSHPVDGAVIEMAACDSQRLGSVRGPETATSPPPPPRAEPATGAEQHEPEQPSPLVGAPACNGNRRRRASQTIPPAVRREVMRRDRARCVVPGCQGHLFLDVHHLDPRSEGGGHDPERLAVLCGSHHRAAHAGTLCIDGCASAGFTFRHADGAPYGQPLEPAAIDVAQQALSALRNLGFRASRARSLVDAVIAAGAPSDVGSFVHAALQAS